MKSRRRTKVAISAQNVKTLREKTGAGIMDCKQALADTDGNIDKAIKLLREKGLAEAQKRSGRAAKEGIITVGFNKENDVASMVEVNCETDFVSRTDKYRDFVENLAKTLLDREIANPKELSEDIGNIIKDAISTFGENIILRKIVRFKKSDQERSVFQSYIHMGGKAGVLVEFLLENKDMTNNDNFQEFAKNVALQIASMSPYAVSRDEFSEEIINEQKEIFTKQASESGKPENIVEKIVRGKMEKFFSETSLLEQKFVKDTNITIGKYLDDTQDKAGGKIDLKRFARFKLGEE
jgi:elongation factor Ts